MKENWKIFEKVIAIIEILVGLSVISLLIYSWSSVFNHMIERGLTTWAEISIFKLIRNAHFLFLSGVMGLASGFLLLKDRKIGWILGVSSWLVYSFGTLALVWQWKNMNDSISNQSYLLSGMLALFFFIMAIFLTLKPYRLKYNPSLKSWSTIGVITLAFIIDKLLIK